MKVLEVRLTNAGSGYTTPPIVKITANEDEHGVAEKGLATATAQLALGRVRAVTVDFSNGEFMTAPVVTFDGGLGEGGVAATAVAFMGE